MSDGLGVRVWRWMARGIGWTYEPGDLPEPADDVDAAFAEEPGLWLSLDPQERAKYREAATLAAAQQMAANRLPGDVTDAVLAVLIGGER